jgi:hypothetical protein
VIGREACIPEKMQKETGKKEIFSKSSTEGSVMIDPVIKHFLAQYGYN